MRPDGTMDQVPMHGTARDMRVLLITMITATVIAALPEAWHPYFYLTNDNLIGTLPVLTEMNRRLWTGQWPLTVDGIFGGHHNLLADPSGFAVLSPWNLLWSWLSLTRYHLVLIEVLTVVHSATTAVAFAWSARWLRNRLQLQIPDWMLVVVSLSYTFSAYNLIVSRAWLGFLNVEVAFPLAVIGLLHPSGARGIALVAGGMLYALLGGHAHQLTACSLILGVLAASLSLTARRITPLVRLIISGAVVAGLSAPVLFPALRALQTSGRGLGMDIVQASRGSITLAVQLGGFLTGPAVLAMKDGPIESATWIRWVLGCSVVNAVAALGVCAAIRHRRMPPLVLSLLVALVTTMVLIARPGWLGHAMQMIPLLRSLRFPYRETWVVLALWHLLAVCTIDQLNRARQQRWLLFGTGMLLFTMLQTVSFAQFATDAQLVVRGTAARYWNMLRDQSRASRPHLVVGGDSALMERAETRLPHALLGTFNFGSLYHFTSESGFSFLPPIRPPRPGFHDQPSHTSGAFSEAAARRIAAAVPGCWLILLERVDPIEWSVTMGPTVRRFRYIPGRDVLELPVMP